MKNKEYSVYAYQDYFHIRGPGQTYYGKIIYIQIRNKVKKVERNKKEKHRKKRKKKEREKLKLSMHALCVAQPSYNNLQAAEIQSYDVH